MNEVIYLDNNSTTKLDPRVLKAMMPFLTEDYANAASPHNFGKRITLSVKRARNQVADLVGCEPTELVFTSGATESINIGIKGIADNYSHKGKHIVTACSEHTAVLETCKFLEKIGFDVTYLPVDPKGQIDINLLEASIRFDTILVCLMLVNNEIGVIHPIKEMARIAHQKGTFFMTDATQAVGKLPVDVVELDVDLMCFSGHKFYGPKGIGALFVKKGLKLNPLIHGGGQEFGLRSGTLNVPAIVGFGVACELSANEMQTDSASLIEIRDFLEQELLKIEDTFVNGDCQNRIFNITNIAFRGLDSDVLIGSLGTISLSNGSACTSTVVEPSHVLKAIGLSDSDAFSSIRFSLGRFNTMEEIILAIKEIKAVISKLRTNANISGS